MTLRYTGLKRCGNRATGRARAAVCPFASPLQWRLAMASRQPLSRIARPHWRWRAV